MNRLLRLTLLVLAGAGMAGGQHTQTFVISGCPKDGTTATFVPVINKYARVEAAGYFGMTIWTQREWDTMQPFFNWLAHPTEPLPHDRRRVERIEEQPEMWWARLPSGMLAPCPWDHAEKCLHATAGSK